MFSFSENLFSKQTFVLGYWWMYLITIEVRNFFFKIQNFAAFKLAETNFQKTKPMKKLLLYGALWIRYKWSTSTVTEDSLLNSSFSQSNLVSRFFFSMCYWKFWILWRSIRLWNPYFNFVFEENVKIKYFWRMKIDIIEDCLSTKVNPEFSFQN